MNSKESAGIEFEGVFNMEWFTLIHYEMMSNSFDNLTLNDIKIILKDETRFEKLKKEHFVEVFDTIYRYNRKHCYYCDRALRIDRGNHCGSCLYKFCINCWNKHKNNCKTLLMKYKLYGAFREILIERGQRIKNYGMLLGMEEFVYSCMTFKGLAQYDKINNISEKIKF